MTTVVGYHNGHDTDSGEPSIQLNMEIAGPYAIGRARRMAAAVGAALQLYDRLDREATERERTCRYSTRSWPSSAARRR